MKSACSALVLCQEILFLGQEIWLCFSRLGSVLPRCVHPAGTEGRLLPLSSLPSVFFALLALPVEVVLWHLLNVRVQPQVGKKNTWEAQGCVDGVLPCVVRVPGEPGACLLALLVAGELNLC